MVWKRRPLRHFADQRSCDSWNTRCEGAEAGRISKNGYVHINLTFEGVVHEFYAHRLAFALMVGRFPADEVDHINRIRRDNTWTNLREATRRENQGYRLDRQPRAQQPGVEA